MSKIVILKVVTELVRDAVDYPLPMRIAAWLHQYGCTEEEYEMIRLKIAPNFPAAILDEIQNALRDFNSGRRPLLARLTKLVEKL